LDTVVSEAERNSREAQSFASLGKDSLQWKPSANQWSIAECLEHLAMAEGAFKPIVIGALARGRQRFPAVSAPPYRPTWMGAWLIRHVSPDAPGKLTAPKVFRPSVASGLSHAVDHFLSEQQQFVKLVQQASGVDYNKVRLRSPVTALIRYSLADAFVVNVVHGQRHLLQARRVLSGINSVSDTKI
jgi:hypothetical protein